ncbi:MAG: hypothetical protein ACREX4_24145, partial [Gammaproteobacteria bacterium]
MDKTTDFNDGATVDLGAAEAPKETIAEAIKRLSALHPIEFDRVRKEEAKKLACKLSTLETEVRKARGEEIEDNGNGRVLIIEDPEPWLRPVNGADLLNRLVMLLRRFVIISDHAYHAIAIWVVHTYA